MSSTPSSPRLRQKAFTLTLKPGTSEEYRRRHDEIWPEMRATLRAHGVHEYSIFAGPSPNQVLAIVTFEDDARWEQIGLSATGARWRRYMSDILECDASLKPNTTLLPEIFRL
jgi:L-rhamnose mutarotase